jgi:hypothetical protein
LLWIGLPLAFFGLLVNEWKDRYLAMIFPAVFLVSAAELDNACLVLKRHFGIAAMVPVIAVLTYAAYEMGSGADQAI